MTSAAARLKHFRLFFFCSPKLNVIKIFFLFFFLKETKSVPGVTHLPACGDARHLQTTTRKCVPGSPHPEGNVARQEPQVLIGCFNQMTSVCLFCFVSLYETATEPRRRSLKAKQAEIVSHHRCCCHGYSLFVAPTHMWRSSSPRFSFYTLAEGLI